MKRVSPKAEVPQVRIREMPRELEADLPPRSQIATFAAALVICMVAEAGLKSGMTWWVGGWHDPSDAARFSQGQFLVHNVILQAGLAWTAVWRAAAFNPALNSRYAAWLQSTPWHSERPLPFATGRLRWVDLLLITVVVAVWTLPAPRVMAVLWFALPYCAFMTFALMRAGGTWSVGGAVALGFGLLLTIGRPHWQATALAAALCVYCDWSFRRALRTFPWPDFGVSSGLAVGYVMRHWPMLHSPAINGPTRALTWLQAVALAALTGWGAFAVATLAASASSAIDDPQDFAKGVLFCLTALGLAAALVRTAFYAMDRSSPLGLWARLRLRRLIIPGYDKILAAPLGAVVMGIVLPRMLIAAGLSLPAVAGVTVACVLLAVLAAGPTLADWELTGEYVTLPRRRGDGWVQAG